MKLRSLLLVAATILGVWHPAVAQSPAPVVIGWSASPDVPQIAQAVDKNLWKQQNIDVKIVNFATGREAFEALIGGQLDFAIMAEFPVVTGAMRNLKFAMPAVLTKYRSMRIIAKGTNPMTLKDLEGRKIAMPLGTNVHYLLADQLKKQGVKAELVNVGPPDMIPALVRGDVDAAMMFPGMYPNAKRALAAQYKEITLPGAVSNFVLVASDKVLTGNPDLVRRVLAALLAGEKMVADDPGESQAATSRYVGTAMTLDAIRASWPDYEFRIQLDKATLDLMVQEGLWLREMGFMKQGEPSAELYSKYLLPGPLKELAPDRVNLP